MKSVKNMKNIFKTFPAFIYGAVFGMALVVPGFSGSTMMVVFGCYDIVCGALALDFGFIKKNIVFLLLFGIGAIIGVFGFLWAVSELFVSYPVPTFLFFIGLIAGSLPVIIKKLRSKGNFKYFHAVFVIIALAAVLTLSIAEGGFEAGEATDNINLLWLFACGFFAAAAMIIPGISGAFVLVLLGAYQPISAAASLSDLNISVLLPAGAGMVLGAVLGAKLIKYLLARFHTAVYSVITGLVIGSVYAIFPKGVKLDFMLVIGIIAFALGCAISYSAGTVNKGEDK